jgi:DMSO/TMAO reductase YedYZ molybdopterin-dependent catalytic subunit
MTVFRYLAWLLFAGLTPAAAAADARIELRGAFDASFVLDASALHDFPRTKVSANDHGRQGIWEGAHLRDVLARAGAPFGESMRGPALAMVVIFTAADGYRAVFALAEFDPALGGVEAVLADTRDGEPLDASEGPFRLVLPGQERQARSVRRIRTIELRALE